MGRVNGEEQRGGECGSEGASAGVEGDEADECGAGRVDQEIGDAETEGVATPQMAIDHETECGEGAQFAELQAPDAVGPFVNEEARPGGEWQLGKPRDVAEVVAEKVAAKSMPKREEGGQERDGREEEAGAAPPKWRSEVRGGSRGGGAHGAIRNGGDSRGKRAGLSGAGRAAFFPHGNAAENHAAAQGR